MTTRTDAIERAARAFLDTVDRIVSGDFGGTKGLLTRHGEDLRAALAPPSEPAAVPAPVLPMQGWGHTGPCQPGCTCTVAPPAGAGCGHANTSWYTAGHPFKECKDCKAYWMDDGQGWRQHDPTSRAGAVRNAPDDGY